ncbi:MAG: hypothetical protein ABEJ70_04230 [Halobacteriaceae archaeon]
MRPASIAAVVLVAVALVAVTAPAAGSSPPQPVCGALCGDRFERLAADQGASVHVGRSTVDVSVRADGSARWTVRTTLAEGVLDESTLGDVARTALGDHPVVDDPRDVSVTVETGTAVVAFTDPDFAGREVGGVLLSESFWTVDHPAYYALGADRVTVRAPPGYRASNHPPGARTNATAAWWTADERVGPETGIPDQAFVAFAPADAPVPGLLTHLAIAARLAPRVVPSLVATALVPLFVLAGGVGAALRLGPRRDGPGVGADTRRLGSLVVGLGLATLLLVVLAGGLSVGGYTGMVYAGAAVAYAGVGVAAVRWRDGEWTLGRGAEAAAAFWILGLAGALVLARYPFDPLLVACATAPTLAAFPLGVAAARAHPRRWLVAAVPFAALAVLAWSYAPVDGSGVGLTFAGVLLAVWAAVTVAAGAPLFLLGRSLAVRSV